jgi:hypothetical protein
VEFLFGFVFRDLLETRVGQFFGLIVATATMAGTFALLIGIPCLYLFGGEVARYTAMLTFCAAVILISLIMGAFREQSGD